MRQTWTGLAYAGMLIGLSWPARCDEPTSSGDLARAQLSRVIAVLQLKPEAAGQSCLDALHEVHQTEDQVKTLQNRAKTPDLGLAQDVLETDYENGDEICGADASRVCMGSGKNGKLMASCKALHGPR